MGMRRTIDMPWSLGNPTQAQLVQRRDRTLPHLQRKLYHAFMGLVCFGLYAFVVSRTQALGLILAIGGSWIVLDLWRLRSPKFNEFALNVFGPLMRKNELNQLSGNSYYIMGMFVVVSLFPKPIALLAILYLSLGDPTAATVGTLFGKTKLWSKKSLEGATANLAISVFATLIFASSYLSLTAPQAAGLALIGGLISMASELAPIKVDDNFTIPVLSASLLFILSCSLSLSPLL